MVMYGCESWTVKKAEHQRIDAFELWCWIRLLGVPWITRRSNQSILKRSVLGVHWKDLCWSWNSNTLATSCRVDSLEKTLMLGGIGGRRRRGRQDEMAGWHHWLDGCEFEWTPGVGDGQGGLACCDSWGCRVRHDGVTELNWIEGQESKIKTKPGNTETEKILICLGSHSWQFDTKKDFLLTGHPGQWHWGNSLHLWFGSTKLINNDSEHPFKV